MKRGKSYGSAPVDPSRVSTCVEVETLINGLPITRHMGARVKLEKDGSLTAWIEEWCDHHLGGLEREWVNGAVLLGLLDCVCVGAGMVRFAGHRCATVDLSVRFSRPVGPDGMRVVGRCVTWNKRMARVEGVVLDGVGRQRVLASAAIMPVESRRADEWDGTRRAQ